MQSSVLFLLALNHILFSYNTRQEKINGVVRFAISLFILIVSGYASKGIEFFDNSILVSNVKLGWIIGVAVVLLINFQFLVGATGQERFWQFMNDEASTTASRLLIIRWIKILMIIFLIFGIISYSVRAIFGLLFLSFLLIIIFIAGRILAKQHLGSNRVEVFKNSLGSRFWMGIFLSGASLFLFFFPQINILSLFILLLGTNLVQKVTSTKESYSSYSRNVTFPGLILIVGLSLIPNRSFVEFNVFLASGENLEQARTILREKRLIEDQINNLYESMKANGELSHYIDPTFETQVVNDKSIWLDPELSIELVYSYELIDPIYRDSVNYFSRGSYTLSRNSVVYAIAKSFELSVKKYLFKYFQLDQKVEINIIGSADAYPIRQMIPYDNEFDYFLRDKGGVEFRCNNSNFAFDVQMNSFNENCMLAFLRALSLQDFINRNIPTIYEKADVEYNYEAIHDEINKGGEFRKAEITLTLYDVLINDR